MNDFFKSNHFMTNKMDNFKPMDYQKRTRISTYSPTSTSSVSTLDSSCLNLTNNHILSTNDTIQKRNLRYDIVLEAPTAVTQKSEEFTITYLNRGQVYAIQLTDKQAQNETITSTLSIDFHLTAHRRVAQSYWTYWHNQQKNPEARTLDIDESQSSGITNISFPGFNKITFKWNGRYGSKVYVRFKCLSTDFSRMKGVKGIPLRVQMESRANDQDKDEASFCRVKLFRDKGAERKNKDDAKQISKQLEKIYGSANEESLPLLYNVSQPYSIFGELSLDSLEHVVEDGIPLKRSARHHTRVMTAPVTGSLLSLNDNNIQHKLKPMTLPASMSPGLMNHKSSPVSPNNIFSSPLKINTNEQNTLYHDQLSLPTTNTCENNFSLDSPCHVQQFDNTISIFDGELSPLSADSLYTSNVVQTESIDYMPQCDPFLKDNNYIYANNYLLTPDLILDTPSNNFFYQSQSLQTNSASLCDIFTPEETQNQSNDHLLLNNPIDLTDNQSKDYFYHMNVINSLSSNHISLLQQQQLQYHNKTTNDTTISIANQFVTPTKRERQTTFNTDVEDMSYPITLSNSINKKRRLH